MGWGGAEACHGSDHLLQYVTLVVFFASASFEPVQSHTLCMGTRPSTSIDMHSSSSVVALISVTICDGVVGGQAAIVRYRLAHHARCVGFSHGTCCDEQAEDDRFGVARTHFGGRHDVVGE